MLCHLPSFQTRAAVPPECTEPFYCEIWFGLGAERVNGTWQTSGENGNVIEAFIMTLPETDFMWAPLTWDIVEQSDARLGCTIVAESGYMPHGYTHIRTGGRAGRITIKCTDSYGKVSTQPLDLVLCKTPNCIPPGGRFTCVVGPCPPPPTCGSGGWTTSVDPVSAYTHLGGREAVARVTIDLGQHDPYFGAGALTLTMTQGVDTTEIRNALGYFYNREHVTVITNVPLGVAQVRAPEVFENTVSNAWNKFTYEFYSLTNASTSIGTNGLYSVSNSPYSTISLELPLYEPNIVRLTRSVAGAAIEVVDYEFLTNGLKMVSGGGTRVEVRTTEWFADNTYRITTHTISNASGAIAYIATEKYYEFAWGEALVERIRGSGSVLETDTFSYNSIGQIQASTNANGLWEYIVFDEANRVSKKLSPWLNQSFTTNESLCRVTEYDYSTNVVSGSGDIGVYELGKPRRTIERILGTEISRQYTMYSKGQRWDVQCVSTGAAWNAAANLVATNTFYTNGAYYGNIRTVARPDKTITSYLYGPIATLTTNILLNGHPDSTGTNIDDGTKMVSIFNSTGQLIEKREYDRQIGRSDILISSAAYQYGGLNRKTNSTYLDGTTSTEQYDCCTVSAIKGRDGSIVSYTYDELHRLLTATASGITISNRYDSEGHLLQQWRIGTNGGVITLEQNGHDVTGRRIATTNAAGDVREFLKTSSSAGTITNILKVFTNMNAASYRYEARYRDGQLSSVRGGLVHSSRYEYGPTNGGTFTKEIKLDVSGSDTSEWTIEFFDAAGRSYKTFYPDGAFSQTFYNQKGQVTNEIDPDSVSTLYQYNNRASREYSVLDLNRNAAIDLGGADRITRMANYVTTRAAYGDVWVTETSVWATNDSNSGTIVSANESTVNGLTNWNTQYGLRTRTEIAQAASGILYVKTISSDNSFTVARFENGRMTSINRTNGDTQLSGVSYGYDEYGRQKWITDARNGTTSNMFDNLDRIISTAMPAPGIGATSPLTSYLFDSLGRVCVTTNSDGTVTYKEYLASGELIKLWGSRAYPVEYTYDYAGRMKTMKTWQDYPNNSGAATTTWNYDAFRGFMTNKVYADGKGPGYRYTPAGRLYQRTWARGLTTTYITNAVGEVSSIGYSDSTPGVIYNYDRLGRHTNIVDGSGTHILSYDLAGNLLCETNTAGLLVGLAVTNLYDSLTRRIGIGLSGDINTLIRCAYDGASRLVGVTNGVNTISYSYVANSPLISQITFKNSGTTRMTTEQLFDHLNRLTLISNSVGGTSAGYPAFGYAHNSANQRAAITNANGSRWIYSYDSLGQVTSGKKYWSDGSLVLGQQFDYTFDDIGNRKTAVSGGDASGNNKRTQTYSANNLNQYSQRTVPGYLDIIGTATTTATVVVNTTATTRKGDYYRAELSVANSATAVWQTITNVAFLPSGTNELATNSIGHQFVPKSAEAFGYDADGNQTNDGRWTLTWDGENRLIQMQSLSSAPIGPPTV